MIDLFDPKIPWECYVVSRPALNHAAGKRIVSGHSVRPNLRRQLNVSTASRERGGVTGIATGVIRSEG